MADLFDKCNQLGAAFSEEEKRLAADFFSAPSHPGNSGPRFTVGDCEYLQFSSNDYLGLAMHPDVVRAAKITVDKCGIGLPMGSRLMTGTSTMHLELEREIAEFKRAEAAIIFPTGAMAMIGMLACLGSPRDMLILDERAHASLVIGARASGAKVAFFRHNDLGHLEGILRNASGIVVEGVYSMGGDLAPLKLLADLKEKYGARLIVDDAHGTGVFGEWGRGTAATFGVENRVDVHAGTFSKAFGTIGGFVAGNKEVIDYLRYQSPTFVYTKSMPLAVVAATLVSLDLLKQADDLRKKLWQNTRQLHQGLTTAGIDVSKTDSPITPIRCSGNDALRLADALRREYNILAPPAIYPAVPKGTSVVRLTPTALHTDSDIDHLIESVKSANALSPA